MPYRQKKLGFRPWVFPSYVLTSESQRRLQRLKEVAEKVVGFVIPTLSSAKGRNLLVANDQEKQIPRANAALGMTNLRVFPQPL